MDTRDTSVKYPVSRLVLAFPAMPDREYRALREDIRETGQQRPIAVLHGEILDGRHRLKACDELGIEPKYVFLPPETDPLKYNLSDNRHRRHLNASQSAIAAARVYLLSQQDSMDEGDTSSESAKLQIRPLTQDEAATMFGVRQRTFSHAVALLTSAPTESLVEAVEQGHIAVRATPRKLLTSLRMLWRPQWSWFRRVLPGRLLGPSYGSFRKGPNEWRLKTRNWDHGCRPKELQPCTTVEYPNSFHGWTGKASIRSSATCPMAMTRPRL